MTLDTVINHGQLVEKMNARQKEVGAKNAHGIPGQQKINTLVFITNVTTSNLMKILKELQLIIMS